MGGYGSYQNFNSDRVHLKAGGRISLSKNMCMRFSSIRMLILKVQLLSKALNECALVNPYKFQRSIAKPMQSAEEF